MAVIAIPVALQNLLTTTGSMLDTVMVASLGPEAVGAMGLCAQFSSLMFSCYWGFVGGGMLFFSQYWGAGDTESMERSYGVTLTFMMAVAFIFSGLALLRPDAVMRLYTDKEVFHGIGISYLRIVGLAYPLQVFSMAMASLLRSTERVKIPLYASICSVVTNVLLNWLLIFGHLGFPRMGIQGAATATVCAGLVNVLVMLVLGRKCEYLFHVKNHFRWKKSTLRIYFQKCAPILANELLIGVGNMIINIVLGRQAEEAIAALAVVRTLEGLVIGFFAGFANAGSILVGKEVGAGRLETAWQRGWRLTYLCMGTIFVICAGLVIFRGNILHLMGLRDASLAAGRGMLTIYCCAAVIRMGNWAQNDIYRAGGDAAFGTILEITFMFLMVVPCVYLTGIRWHLSYLIVFACCYADEIIRFVLMQLHMKSGRWVKPVTEQGRAALEEFRSVRGGKAA